MSEILRNWLILFIGIAILSLLVFSSGLLLSNEVYYSEKKMKCDVQEKNTFWKLETPFENKLKTNIRKLFSSEYFYIDTPPKIYSRNFDGEWSNINNNIFEFETEVRERICRFVDEKTVLCKVLMTDLKPSDLQNNAIISKLFLVQSDEDYKWNNSVIRHKEFYDFKNFYLRLSANDKVIVDSSCVELM